MAVASMAVTQPLFKTILENLLPRVIKRCSSVVQSTWFKHEFTLSQTNPAVKPNSPLNMSIDPTIDEYTMKMMHGALFPTEIYIRGCHWFRRLVA